MEILNVLAAALGACAFGAVWYIGMAKLWIAASDVAVVSAGRPQGNRSPMPYVVVVGMMRHVFVMASMPWSAAASSA